MSTTYEKLKREKMKIILIIFFSLLYLILYFIIY